MVWPDNNSQDDGEGIFGGLSNEQKRDLIIINEDFGNNNSASEQRESADNNVNPKLEGLSANLTHDKLKEARNKLKRSSSSLLESALNEKDLDSRRLTVDLQDTTQFILDSLDKQLEQFGKTQELYLDKERKLKFKRALSDLQRRPQINEIDFAQLIEEHRRRGSQRGIGDQVTKSSKRLEIPAACSHTVGSEKSSGDSRPTVRSNETIALSGGSLIGNLLQLNRSEADENVDDVADETFASCSQPNEALSLHESYTLEYKNIELRSSSDDDIVKLSDEPLKSFHLIGHGEGLFIVEDVNNDNIIPVNDSDSKSQSNRNESNGNYLVNCKGIARIQGRSLSINEEHDRWLSDKLSVASEQQAIIRGPPTGDLPPIEAKTDTPKPELPSDFGGSSNFVPPVGQIGGAKSAQTSDESSILLKQNESLIKDNKEDNESDGQPEDGFYCELELGQRVGSALEGVAEPQPATHAFCSLSSLVDSHAYSPSDQPSGGCEADNITGHQPSCLESPQGLIYRQDHKLAPEREDLKFHSLASEIEASSAWSFRSDLLSRELADWGAPRESCPSSELIVEQDSVKSTTSCRSVSPNKQTEGSLRSTDSNDNLLYLLQNSNYVKPTYQFENPFQGSDNHSSQDSTSNYELDHSAKRKKRKRKKVKRRNIIENNDRKNNERLETFYDVKREDAYDNLEDGNELKKQTTATATTTTKTLTRANSISYWIELDEKGERDKSDADEFDKREKDNRLNLSALDDEMKFAKELAKITAPSLSSLQLLPTYQLKELLSSSSLYQETSSTSSHRDTTSSRTTKSLVERVSQRDDRYTGLVSRKSDARRGRLLVHRDGSRLTNNLKRINKQKLCNMETSNAPRLSTSFKRSLKGSSTSDLKQSSNRYRNRNDLKGSNDKLKKEHKSLNRLCLCCCVVPPSAKTKGRRDELDDPAAEPLNGEPCEHRESKLEGSNLKSLYLKRAPETRGVRQGDDREELPKEPSRLQPDSLVEKHTKEDEAATREKQSPSFLNILHSSAHVGYSRRHLDPTTGGRLERSQSQSNAHSYSTSHIAAIHSVEDLESSCLSLGSSLDGWTVSGRTSTASPFQSTNRSQTANRTVQSNYLSSNETTRPQSACSASSSRSDTKSTARSSSPKKYLLASRLFRSTKPAGDQQRSFLSRSLSKLTQQAARLSPTNRKRQPGSETPEAAQAPLSINDQPKNQRLAAPSIVLSPALQGTEPTLASETPTNKETMKMCPNQEETPESDPLIQRIVESLDELDNNESFALDKLDQTSEKLDKLSDLLSSAREADIQFQSARFQRIKKQADDVMALTQWIGRADALFNRKLGSATETRQLHREMSDFFSPANAPRLSVSICPALDGQYRNCLAMAKQRILTIEQVLKNWDQYYQAQSQLKSWMRVAEEKLAHVLEPQEDSSQPPEREIEDLTEFFELERADEPSGTRGWRSRSNEFIFPMQSLGSIIQPSSFLTHYDRSFTGSILSLASISSRISLPLQSCKRATHTKLFEEFELRCSLLAAMLEPEEKASLSLGLRELRNRLNYIVGQRVPQIIEDLRASCVSRSDISIAEEREYDTDTREISMESRAPTVELSEQLSDTSVESESPVAPQSPTLDPSIGRQGPSPEAIEAHIISPLREVESNSAQDNLATPESANKEPSPQDDCLIVRTSNDLLTSERTDNQLDSTKKLNHTSHEDASEEAQRRVAPTVTLPQTVSSSHAVEMNKEANKDLVDLGTDDLDNELAEIGTPSIQLSEKSPTDQPKEFIRSSLPSAPSSTDKHQLPRNSRIDCHEDDAEECRNISRVAAESFATDELDVRAGAMNSDLSCEINQSNQESHSSPVQLLKSNRRSNKKSQGNQKRKSNKSKPAIGGKKLELSQKKDQSDKELDRVTRSDHSWSSMFWSLFSVNEYSPKPDTTNECSARGRYNRSSSKTRSRSKTIQSSTAKGQEPEAEVTEKSTTSDWPIWNKIKRAYKASFTLNIALLICLAGICIVPIWNRDACCELSPRYPIPSDETFAFNQPKPT